MTKAEAFDLFLGRVKTKAPSGEAAAAANECEELLSLLDGFA